jgi:hypothetical protein
LNEDVAAADGALADVTAAVGVLMERACWHVAGKEAGETAPQLIRPGAEAFEYRVHGWI